MELLSEQEVLVFLGINASKVKSLRKWVRDGVIPGTVLPGGDMAFSRRLIIEWVENNTFKPQQFEGT